jgi:hypothetical protein
MLLIALLSLVTLFTLSKEPIAVDMKPVGASAELSFPEPTTRGLGPFFGSMGSFRGGAHAISCHSMLG